MKTRNVLQNETGKKSGKQPAAVIARGLALLLILIAFTQCAFGREFMRHTRRDVGYGGYRTLAAGELPGKCKPEKTARQWYFFFGSFNLFGDSIEETLTQKDKVFRIRQYTTLLDTIASVGIGIFTSITVQTVDIQVCESQAGGLAAKEARLREMQAKAAKLNEDLEKRKLELEEKEKALLEKEKRLQDKPGGGGTTTP